MISFRLPAVLAATLAISLCAHAQEWTRFRGPNGSGSAALSGLPEAFGKDKNLRWRRELAPGHSSPVLAEGGAFLTGADEQSLIVSCVARDSGAMRWEQRFERARKQEVYPANGSAAPSPVTDGKGVYAFFPELGLVALDADGTERWRLALGPFESFYGMAGSPILAGDTLVLLCDQQRGSFLLGVDAASGKERWRTERKGLIESWTTPVLVPAETPRSLIAFGTFFVAGYSLASGKEEWRVGSVGYTPVCSPCLWERAEGTLLFTSVPFHAEGGGLPGFESLLAEDADKDGALTRQELAKNEIVEHFGWADSDFDGRITRKEWDFIQSGFATKDHGLVAFALEEKGPRELWRVKRSLPSIATPLVHEGIVYLVKSGGMLTTLDAESGAELGFQRLENAAGEYDASPVAADGKLFLASQEGRISVLALGPEPKLLSSCDLGEPIHATPALGKDGVYVRTGAALYRFALKE